MKSLESGKLQRLAVTHAPIPGCTIAQQIVENPCISLFSLAAHTDISAECYANKKLWIVLEGETEVRVGNHETHKLQSYEGFITPKDLPVGCASQHGSIHLEAELGKETKMNEMIKAGTVFALKELLPYQEGVSSIWTWYTMTK